MNSPLKSVSCKSPYLLLSILLALTLSSTVLSCKKGVTETIDEFTVTFDAKGGSPTPSSQKVAAMGLIIQPTDPTKADSVFIGWFTTSNIKFNFKSNPVTKDLALSAKWWGGPEKYVFVVAADWEYSQSRVNTNFGSSKAKSVAVGVCPVFYIFERPASQVQNELQEHLRLSEELEIPILVQFDAITFMDARPDLWNWWDPTMSGYNPDNKNNVEWTSWSSDDAVKIGWLNWGQQIRLNPMPNLMSPVYRKAVADDMTNLVNIVNQWYKNLPTVKKYLFGGIKVTGEMYYGVNNWYYPNGNSYLNQDPSLDPKTGINVNDLPSRGVQTIGYAALKTAGIKTSGEITGDDIAELAHKHTEILSKLCADLGIPRDHIFAHAGGSGKDLEACLNQYASPAWSFYNQDATNPAGFTQALDLLKVSDAPYFGIAEWSIGDSTDQNKWMDAISNGLSIPRCRFLSIYANVVGSDYYKTNPNLGAVQGIKGLQY